MTSPSMIALLTVALSTIVAIGLSNSVIYGTDLLLPEFTSRFDNYAFATGIPLAVAPLLILPLAYTISRLMTLNAEVQRRARTDALTGLLNPHGFFERAERALELPDERDDVVLMMVDVDRFKEVNDTYGHAVGDDWLRHIAHSIDEAVGADIAQRVVGRIGGDEFSVLLVGQDASAASASADRICQFVRRRGGRHDGLTLVPTVSVGVAMRAPGQPLDAAMRAADDAAYQAKRAGRDCWVLAASSGYASPRATTAQAA